MALSSVMAVVAFSLHILGFVSHPLAALPPRPPRTHAASAPRSSSFRRSSFAPLLALRRAKVGEGSGTRGGIDASVYASPALDTSTRRTDESQMVWYLQKIYDPGNKRLLTAPEELRLSGEVQRLLEVERGEQDLRAHLGRQPTEPELAEHLGILHLDDLAAVRKDGQASWERLLVSNQRLVVSVAKRYMGKGLLLEDMIQEGNLGLIRAVQLFDPKRKLR